MTYRKVKALIGAGLFLFGLFLLIRNFIPVKISKYRKPDSELTSLTAYLINPPTYIRKARKGGRTCLQLQLDQFVGVSFENDDEFLDATDWEAVIKEIKYHDTVTIKVLKASFDKYYVNHSSLSDFQKLANGHSIDRFRFYSLQFKGKEYVHDIYTAAEKRRKENITLIIFSLLIMAAGVYAIRAK